MSLTRHIFSNTVVQVLGKVITTALSIITIKLITTHLGQSGYGDYIIIFEYLAFFGIIADMGLFTIAVREMSHDGADSRRLLHNILSIRLILAIITMTAAIVAAQFIDRYGPEVRTGIIIAAGATLLSFIGGTVSSILQVNLKMHYYTLATILGKSLATALIYRVVVLGLPFLQLIYAGLYGNIVMCLAILIFASRYIRLGLAFDFPFWGEIIRRAFPYGLALILSTIYFRIDSLMLYHLQGRAATGIYGVAMRFIDIINILPVIFLNSVLPTLTRSLDSRDRTKTTSIIQRSFDFLALAALPIISGTLVLATPIILFVSDQQFLASTLPLQIIIFAILGSFLNSVFGYSLVAAGFQTRLLAINATAALFNIVANLVFIPIYSVVGAAATTVATEALILSLTLWQVYRLIGFAPRLRTFGLSLASAIIMGIIITLLPVHFLISVAIGGLLYAIMIYFSRAIDPEVLRKLLS